ncbi:MULTISPECIES: TetR/AcrR family transcriptional regulator [unclassified Nonomuraea]|uniref:TetR/AcrR family transcriptional regulator n=1 Tax=unclassified Nonomuraea TaxID=2593643 RepID=UPI0033D59FA3
MPGPKSADQGREVRGRLLRVAAELIAERGWSAVSTRMLAERAGVTPGLVHYHFSSVHALLTEAAIGTMRGLVEGVGPLLEQAGTAEEALDLMLATLDEHDGRDPMSLLFTETYLAATRDETLRRSLAEVINAFRDRLASRLAAQGVAAPDQTAAVVAAAIDGLMLHRAFTPDLTAPAVAPVLRRLLDRRELSRKP